MSRRSSRSKKALILKAIIVPICVLLICFAVSPLLLKEGKGSGNYSIGNIASYIGNKPDKVKDTITVSCIGDSITYGIGSGDVIKGAYQKRLKELLSENYECNVYNYGHSGATILSDVEPHINYTETNEYKISLESDPDIVVIMLGTNDSWYITEERIPEFSDNLSKITEAYKSLPSSPKVYLCTPTYRYRDELCIYNTDNIIVPCIKESAKENNVVLIDIYEATKNKEALFYDGIHPTKDGYEYIADMIYNAILP